MAWQSDDTNSKKRLFAYHWLRTPNDPFRAGIVVFGQTNAGQALMACSDWINDPIVLDERDRLIAEKGELAFMPSRYETARNAMSIFETSRDPENKLKALKLYADIMGHIPKDTNSMTGQFTVVLSKTDAKI